MFYASTTSKIRAAILVTATLLTSPAFAHGGSHHAADLMSGLMHSLMGLDHLLAMIAAAGVYLLVGAE